MRGRFRERGTSDRLELHCEGRPLHRAIEAIYVRPFQEAARETLNRDLRTGVTDEKLVNLVLPPHEEDRLCVHEEDAETREPRSICSLGIKEG